MKNKRNQGITLIALVVTIIVLLILAGISIAMLTGQNGILNKSVEAKEKTESGNELELVKTSAMEALTEGKGIVEEENLKKALDKNIGEYEIEENEGWLLTKNERKYKIETTGEVIFPVPERIEITPPTKTIYTSEEEFDKNGMKVIAYYGTNKSKEVTNMAKISGYDKNKAGYEKITVEYGGCTETFFVEMQPIYTITVNGKYYAKGKYNDRVELIAEEIKDGKNFSGWKFENMTISTSNNYVIYITGNNNYEAVYGENLSLKEDVVITNGILEQRQDGKGDIKFVLMLLKGDFNIEEAGLIWTGKNKKNVPKLCNSDGTLLDSRVHKTTMTYDNTLDVNLYALKITGVIARGSIRGIAYAKLVKDGETKWIFSEEKAIANK